MRTCAVCPKELVQRWGERMDTFRIRRTCGGTCTRVLQQRNRRRDPEDCKMQCEVCETWFSHTRPRRSCSDECRDILRSTAAAKSNVRVKRMEYVVKKPVLQAALQNAERLYRQYERLSPPLNYGA